LHRIGQRFRSAFENRVAFLFCQNIERAQKGKAGIDQGGKLPGENHQDLRFHLLPLEKRDASLALRRRDNRSSGTRTTRSFYFSIARRWRFPFFINAGREISRLPQMPDGLISRISLD
jgi:hypothetical protein